VECLLTVHRDVVSQRLDGLTREGLVDAFSLLQAGHVRLAFLKPSQDIVEPLLDRIDVPGRYSHCTLPASSDFCVRVMVPLSSKRPCNFRSNKHSVKPTQRVAVYP